jgi:tetratricopeptide (TPR) repeat protein
LVLAMRRKIAPMNRSLVVATLLAAGFLASATPAHSQVRRIQGKVVDEHGTPVADALIEAAIVALPDVAFGVRRTDETWRTRTNTNGNYIVTVPGAGEYLVTATKDGVGSDHTRIAVQRSGLVTANLILWRVPAAAVAGAKCGTNAAIGAFKRSALAAGANAGLARLLGWLEGLQLHTPGCTDSPAVEIGRWPLRDLEALLRDVRELVTFLQRAQDERMERTGRGSAQRDQLIFFIYERRFTLDELQREFYGGQLLRPNDVLLRGAVLHADIAMFVPGEFGRYPLVQDGGRRGWRGGSWHWEVGRQLLDSIAPAPSADAGALLWYRAVSAHLFRAGNLAELATHLSRARNVFPKSPDILFDSAYLHQELSSPPIQASAQQLRADSVSIAVNSRRSELERAERFLRDALLLAPDDANARLRLGHTLGELGRHKEAATELRRAIDANPDGRELYLAALFLGREEEMLGRRHDAKHRYEQAADLFPSAQSPRLALSRLARHSGDRRGAQQSLRHLAPVSGRDPSDPWWEFYESHQEDADSLVERMRQIGR